MSTFKKAKVVMLPSKEKAPVILWEDGELTVSTKCTTKFTPENYSNLYFITDDEIKEGDYFLSNTGSIIKHNERSYAGMISRRIVESDKKIIATTDSSLKVWDGVHSGQAYPLGLCNDDGLTYISLPQPSQEFTVKYIKAYNERTPITEVLVEYEDKGYQKLMNPEEPIPTKQHHYWIEDIKIKISKDNIITIKKVKDSWSTLEVSGLLRKFENECFLKFYKNKDHTDRVLFLGGWIEENL